MKLPNDLIKATDYDKAKDREIHEFECVNGKVIQHYALGGEHELTMQEIVDCLNAIATIDCDLQTAYAYIKGQEQKISDLEAKLAESEEAIKYLKGIKRYDIGEMLTENAKLKQQLAELKEYIGCKGCVDVIAKSNQDKISFAVEQLEKARNLLFDAPYEFDSEEWCWVEEQLDNQIKQLKEGK